ncbi:DUF6385 domain-containing protein [Bacillus sp. 1P06AnD]|uniref:DUF6385 domain-containing protein n=1 Tax=Bacillus sp. 1P06AnD TaxID=3132208 RepID=UPI0039A23A98
MNEKMFPEEEQRITYKEAVKQEVQIGEEFPNQWSLKLKTIESILIPDSSFSYRESSPDLPTVDIKRHVLLKKDGKASITYDVSQLDRYTLSIINESALAISYKVEISPDQFHYRAVSTICTINPGEMECFFSNEYMKYARVLIMGEQVASAIIILQGKR